MRGNMNPKQRSGQNGPTNLGVIVVGVCTCSFLVLVDKWYNRHRVRRQKSNFKKHTQLKSKTKTLTNKSKSTKQQTNLTHFWAVQINDKCLQEQIATIQSTLFEKSEGQRQFIINPAKFHITLGLFSLHTFPQLLKLHSESNTYESSAQMTQTNRFSIFLNVLKQLWGQAINDEDKIKQRKKMEYRAEYDKCEKQLIKNLKANVKQVIIDSCELKNIFHSEKEKKTEAKEEKEEREKEKDKNCLQLTFTNISGFGAKGKNKKKNKGGSMRVLYLDMDEKSVVLLSNLFKKIEIICRKNGINMMEYDKQFTPHMTIAKVKNNKFNRRKKNGSMSKMKHFDENVMNQLQCEKLKQLCRDICKYKQNISVLQLCRMTTDGQTKYYQVVLELPIQVCDTLHVERVAMDHDHVDPSLPR